MNASRYWLISAILIPLTLAGVLAGAQGDPDLTPGAERASPLHSEDASMPASTSGEAEKAAPSSESKPATPRRIKPQQAVGPSLYANNASAAIATV